MITAINTEADYRAALARIDAIFDAEHGTPEGDELDALCDLVMAYESQDGWQAKEKPGVQNKVKS